ncbi:hypothetical protein BH683_010685 [Williamsia sp. 1138]|uniref:hypothetical protein n=1 Tax=Williamsia sp. 1138 TaxID=1903117 RepID=UPI000A10E146|nr:hypothetical protein [Williamsia sp. 1138]OZG29127.1 hypothetical protein BH683_010685 [Williamsia sp. 1138]
MTAWIEVLKTMVDGPHAPIQGVISRSGEVQGGLYGHMGDIAPVYVSGVDDLQVWRDGPKVRVETVAGDLVVMTDGQTVWRFARHEELPLRGAAREMSFIGPGKELLVTRSAGDWVGGRWTTPTGPIRDIEYLGRPCWSVELAPPRDKEPYARQLTVDQRTGAVLQQRVDAAGTAVSFIEFTAGIPIDPAMFVWTGEIGTSEFLRRGDFHSMQTPSVGIRKDEQHNWFREHVTSRDLAIPITLDLNMHLLRSHEEDGSFDAAIGEWPLGRLARRRRSTDEWFLGWDIPVVHAWTAGEFDWVVGIVLGDLAAESLAMLQRLLHPEEPVSGTPPLAPWNDDTGSR